MRSWSVYIIRCGDGTLYTGITTEIERRLREHEGGAAGGARYLRGRGPLRVVCTLAATDHGEALRIERRVKKLPRKKKEMLIAGHHELALPRAERA